MNPTPESFAAANDAEYDVEVLCADWNPLPAAVAEPVEAVSGLMAEPSGGDTSGGDIETFLLRFYQFQQG